MFEFFLYLFRIMENRYVANNEPRFSHREVGFCCFDVLRNIARLLLLNLTILKIP